MKLVESTEQDIDQLTAWIQADPYHKDCLNPMWWLTGAPGSFLSFRFEDDTGVVCYVRLDIIDDICRLHTQFAPETEVSKSRLVKSMLKGLPVIMNYCKQNSNGIVFESTSESLIKFMTTAFGFKKIEHNDYLLMFQEGI